MTVHHHGRRGLPLIAASLALFIAVPAFAQSDDTLMLMNRLNDLEAQVQQLKAGGGAPRTSGYPTMAPATGGAMTGPAAADQDARIGQLQDQVRNLTGELETENNEIAQLRTENQRINQDMQLRLNDLEAKVGGPGPGAGAPTSLSNGGGSAPQMGETGASMYGPGSTQQQSSSGSLGTTLVPGPDGAVPAGSAAATPEKEYEIAYNELGQGDYAGAENGFTAFLQKYPKHALAANAKYWLGESYFQRGMTAKAATTFAESYRQFPNGPKAPDSLLRLGMSLGQQGKNQQACVAFAELTKQFPAASPKIKTPLAQERTRYGCQ